VEKTAQGIVRTVKSFSYPKICKFISIFFIFFIFHQNCIFAQQDDKGIDGPKLISKRFVPLPQLQTPTPVEEIKSVPQEQEVEEKKEISESEEVPPGEEPDVEEKCQDGVMDVSGAPGCSAHYTKCMPSGRCTMGAIEGTVQQQKTERHSISVAGGCIQLSVSQQVTCGCDGKVQSAVASVESCSVEKICMPDEIKEVFSTGECSPDMSTKVLPSACGGGGASISETGGQINWENGCNEWRSQSFSIPKATCQAVVAPSNCPSDHI